MDKKKVEKIQAAILENPEIHNKLTGALRELLNKVGETFSAEELFAALKANVKDYTRECGNTYQAFWGHYKK